MASTNFLHNETFYQLRTKFQIKQGDKWTTETKIKFKQQLFSPISLHQISRKSIISYTKHTTGQEDR